MSVVQLSLSRRQALPLWSGEALWKYCIQGHSVIISYRDSILRQGESDGVDVFKLRGQMAVDMAPLQSIAWMQALRWILCEQCFRIYHSNSHTKLKG